MHLPREIGPVKSRHDLHRGLQAKQADDLLPDRACGCGGERCNRRTLEQGFYELPDFQIGWPEVLSPLRDAVGFIHRNEADVQLPADIEKRRCHQALGCRIHDFVLPLPQSCERCFVLRGRQGAVEICSGDPCCHQFPDLVLHKADER